MATFRAGAAICDAVLNLLRSQYRPADFNGVELDFRAYTPHDFTNAMATGVSCFLYRLAHSPNQRLSAGRPTGDGRQQKPPLALEFHLLLTIWAKDAVLQNVLVGWVARVLEDMPVLPAGLMNTGWPDVFRAEETITIVPEEVHFMDLLHMWEKMGAGGWRPSLPYTARVVMVDSLQSHAVAPATGVAGSSAGGSTP